MTANGPGLNLPPAEELAKLPRDGGDEFNRLVFEQSPYLLQHARNPVDWYPWGPEAFAEAKKTDKPIFLSIGYSTCHWCHVMEHESFEDSSVAAMLNADFISIKVDREERPDIDNIYMTVTQMLTRSGGWPMTIVMDADQMPFFAGTYFPKQSMTGRIGMVDLLPRLVEAWKTKREDLTATANQITQHLQNSTDAISESAISKDVLDQSYRHLQGNYDPVYGGFGDRPKFPTPHNLTFLLRYWKKTGDAEALAMVEKTLKAMRFGGIYDHVGFGFHRYSTDKHWFLPHFEKMLYDQALLVIAYTETYQATGSEFYKTTAEEILEYVLRDMTSPEGGFYSAEDADSEGEEGKFYLWSEKEIDKVLSKEEAVVIKAVFNTSAEGNYHEEASGKRTGSNILYLSKKPGQVASEMGLKLSDFDKLLESSRRKLFESRKSRIHPLKDDKILTDWNGLMIAAFAIAGRALQNPRYIDAAKKASSFVAGHLQSADGLLLKRYRKGSAALPAHIDDYAFYQWGLLELYQSTYDVAYFKSALDIHDLMMKYFWDNDKGGFHFTDNIDPDLIARMKELYDGAIPSGNSVAALNLTKLGYLTGRPEFLKLVASMQKTFAGQINRSPVAYTQFLNSIDYLQGPSREIVISAVKKNDAHEMLQAINRIYLPNKVVILRLENNKIDLSHLADYTRNQEPIDQMPTAYVCTNFACKLPTTDVQVMLELANKQ